MARTPRSQLSIDGVEVGSKTHLGILFKNNQTENLSLCGAGVAHSLGKGEATGSNPVKGNFINE